MNLYQNMSINENEDRFECRVVKLKGIKLIIRVENAIPIVITKDNYINELTVKEATSNVTLNDEHQLTDDDFQNRFIMTGSVKSTITHNVVIFYYDKKYKDILILPNVEFLHLGLVSDVYEVRASRLGSGGGMPNQLLGNSASMDKIETYELPETKSGIKFKSRLVTIPGSSVSSNINKDNGFEEAVSNTVTIYHRSRRVSELVELGTAKELFTKVDRLPLYLMYQYSLQEYGIKYISNVDPGNNKLYIRLIF